MNQRVNMNKVIIKSNSDGSCEIIHPADEMFDPSSRTRSLLPQLKDSSEEEILSFIISKSRLEDGSYRIADKSELPESRAFRGAWTNDNEQRIIDVDINKAKEIHKDKLRVLRKPLLEELDIEYMRALELGFNTEEIVEKKQELRDVTELELPNGLSDLESFIPEILR